MDDFDNLHFQFLNIFFKHIFEKEHYQTYQKYFNHVQNYVREDLCPTWGFKTDGSRNYKYQTFYFRSCDDYKKLQLKNTLELYNRFISKTILQNVFLEPIFILKNRNQIDILYNHVDYDHDLNQKIIESLFDSMEIFFTFSGYIFYVIDQQLFLTKSPQKQYELVLSFDIDTLETKRDEKILNNLDNEFYVLLYYFLNKGNLSIITSKISNESEAYYNIVLFINRCRIMKKALKQFHIQVIDEEDIVSLVKGDIEARMKTDTQSGEGKSEEREYDLDSFLGSTGGHSKFFNNENIRNYIFSDEFIDKGTTIELRSIPEYPLGYIPFVEEIKDIEKIQHTNAKVVEVTPATTLAAKNNLKTNKKEACKTCRNSRGKQKCDLSQFTTTGKCKSCKNITQCSARCYNCVVLERTLRRIKPKNNVKIECDKTQWTKNKQKCKYCEENNLYCTGNDARVVVV